MKAIDGEFPNGLAHLVSWEVADLADWPALLAAICALLARLIRCDEVVWDGVDLDPRHPRVIVYGTEPCRYHDPAVQDLLLELDDHPVINHYLQVGPGSSPVRLGDIASDREFKGTRTWTDLFCPRDVTRQLTIPTCFSRSGIAASAWSFNRSGSEFSDSDLALASTLQPVLAAIEESAAWRPDPDDAKVFGWGPWARRPEINRAEATDADGVGAEQARMHLAELLTAREIEVLSLVATGLTANAIGHRLRISVTTVRKHLEHIYEKTGHHDRLLAVAHARRIGLIPR